MTRACMLLFVLKFACPVAGLAEMAREPAREIDLEPLDIVGVAPLPGLGQPLERVPSNVQLLDGRVGLVRSFASYSYTRATFETSETFPSPVGENLVRPGDVIPGVPDHLLKAGFDAPLPQSFRLGFDLGYAGRQFLRTDESNQRPPLSAYVVVHARLEYTRGPFTLFARAENLFDADYETGGSQGENVFAGGQIERFVSPGAPLGGWFGVRVEL